MDNQSHEPEYLLIVLSGIIALMGGVCKELSNFESTFSPRRFFSNIFISFFSGVLLSLFLNDFEHKTLVMGLSGCAGLMGVTIIDYLTDLFKVILRHMAGHAIGHEITQEDLDNVKNKKEEN